MKMHVLKGGRLRMRKSVYLPDADRSETFELPVSCVLLKHPQGNVLFDTGCHPSTIDNAEARWGPMARAMIPVAGPEDNVVSELDKLGMTPADIDVVVNSHFHSDHCGCNEFFKRATIVCHRKELESAQSEDGVKNGYIPADWKHPMPIDAIEAQRDLYGDGRIVLLPLPGHTQGTLGALVGLERDGAFLLAADAVALRANLDREIVPKNTWNAELATRSMDEIRRIQARGTTVIFGHDEEQWKTLRKGHASYE